MARERDNRMDPAASADRRAFLKLGAAAGGAALLTQPGQAADTSPVAAPNPATAASMPTRNLGRTGHRVGLFSLGGQAALERGDNEAVAVPLIERALDLGVNYIDTAAIYGPSRSSERYIGQVMRRRRAECFLTSKTIDRTRDGSLRILDESLRLLNTDHLDLWQLHDIGLPRDIEAVFAPGGAIEALLRAREQKLVRHLGITGHFRPDALLEGLRRFPFDTLLLAVNPADPQHFSFLEQLLPFAVEKQIGLIGMKVPARGRLLSTWTPPPLEQQRHSWEGAVLAERPGALLMKEAMAFALTLPLSTVIVGCDSLAQLEENVQTARDFTPLSERQMAALIERAAPVAKQALFFRFVSRG